MARRSGRQAREFEWARSNGFLVGAPAPGMANVAVGSADLLADARTRWGNALLRGATVMTLRGWLRPNFANNVRLSGRAGVRVCSTTDIEQAPSAPDETPFGDGAYEDWMGLFYYDQYVPEGTSMDQFAATWSPGSEWSVNVQSNRIMSDAGLTLGLFFVHTNVYDPSGAGAVSSLDYDLSIGLKLA